MNYERSKIDAHGHFFQSYLGPENKILDYWKEAAKIGIVRCVMSPGPTPVITTNEGLYHSAIWKISPNGHVVYVEQVIDAENGQILRENTAQRNPYAFTNNRLIEVAKNWNARHNEQISVMPTHHPYLDTEDEIIGLIKSNDSAAIKFHGIATYAGPSSIRSEVILALKETDKPIVVHTDYYSGVNPKGIDHALIMNDAIPWVHWALRHDVKILLTHGARLSPVALSLAKGHKNIMIGSAPDLLLALESKRLAIHTNDFMRSLFSMVPADQIVFDIDYAWNITKSLQWEQREWRMHERVLAAADRVGFGVKQVEQIFYLNAQRFFKF